MSQLLFELGRKGLFFANVDCLFHGFPTAGVLEPKEGFEERHQLLLARVMAIPDNGLIPLRAANLSSAAITLYRGTTIGKFYPLSEWKEITTEGAEYCEIPPESNNRSVNQVRVEQSAAELLGIDVTNMEEHQKKALEELVQEFSNVFSTGKQDLTDWVLPQHLYWKPGSHQAGPSPTTYSLQARSWSDAGRNAIARSD